MRRFTRGFLTGLFVGPLVAALIAVSGFWPITAVPDLPWPETMMARRAFNASIAHQAPSESKIHSRLPATCFGLD